jgi:hypothetical protein
LQTIDQNTVASKSAINLPGRYLPVFDENYKDCTQLNSYKNLMYLRACLCGEVAQLIKLVDNSAANYAYAIGKRL